MLAKSLRRHVHNDHVLESQADSTAQRVVRSDLEPVPNLRPSHGTPIRSGTSTDREDATTSELGVGHALGLAELAFLGHGFGRDLEHVRLHTGSQADRSARALSADAYTIGSHIVFRAGQFSPHTRQGQTLLAHEVAHVLQQQTSGLGPQRKPSAVRFQDEPTLDDVSEGKKVLKEGDKGEAVIRVTTALAELGTYTNAVIDESFDPPLTSAVVTYQAAKGLTGKVAAGEVDKATFTQLDQDFMAGFKVELAVLGKQKSADILKQTQTLDPAERTASARAISTLPRANPITGLPPVFVPDIPLKGKFADRLKAVVEAEIVAEYNMYGKNKAAQHADPTKLYSWPTVDAIAAESKHAVERVFKEYLVGRPVVAFTSGTRIFDAWTDKVAQLTVGGPAAENQAATWRVQKILDMDDKVVALDDEHGADHSRAPEKSIVDKVRSDMLAKYRAELIETHKGWPGYEDSDKVFIQRFLGTTADERRHDRWDFFQTFIHEYTHSLEHPDHVSYRSGLGEKSGDATLREGTTDYFTKIVWNSLTINENLRKKIEGPVHDPMKVFAIQPLSTYREALNAERLAGIVGIRNLAAAFFLGKVELIGKP